MPYGGGGGGPRRVGTVRDWAQGFFVAGSTLDDLNGVYALVDPNTLRRACPDAALQSGLPQRGATGWQPAGPPVGLKTKSVQGDGVVFVDQSGKDRFEHAATPSSRAPAIRELVTGRRPTSARPRRTWRRATTTTTLTECPGRSLHMATGTWSGIW